MERCQRREGESIKRRENKNKIKKIIREHVKQVGGSLDEIVSLSHGYK